MQTVNSQRLFGIALGSFLLYFLLSFSISKPLTTGEIERLYAQKIEILRTTSSPRIFILAGSNGRFSHSCAVMHRETGRNCGNLSIAAGLGLDFLFSSYLRYFREGDVVYLPLEFEQYALERNEVYSGPDNTILLKSERDLLFGLGWRRVARAFFYGDERYFIQGLVETGLARKGVKRRFSEASINEFGDQQGHTPESAQEYRNFVLTQKQSIPDLSKIAPASFSNDLVVDFLKNAKNKGVTVIGGLPTTFSDSETPPATIAYLQRLYESSGQHFVAVASGSKYDRTCFFDIAYHLNSVCQEQHSKYVVEAIRKYL